MGCSVSLVLISSSMAAKSSRSRGKRNMEMDMPLRPALAVLPTRWMYSFGVRGSMWFITSSTLGISRPLAATSVAISVRIWLDLKRLRAATRSFCRMKPCKQTLSISMFFSVIERSWQYLKWFVIKSLEFTSYYCATNFFVLVKIMTLAFSFSSRYFLSASIKTMSRS